MIRKIIRWFKKVIFVTKFGWSFGKDFYKRYNRSPTEQEIDEAFELMMIQWNKENPLRD